MLLIYRAILRELMQNLIISLAFLNALFVIEKLMKLSKVFSSVGIDIFNLILLVLLLQPQLLIFTIPMSLLLATLLTYGRAQTDNEMIILMVSGLPYKSTFKPAIYVGLAAFLLSMVMSFYLAPTGIGVVREKVLTILAERAPMGIEEGVFNQGFKGITIFVKEKPDSLRLKEIVIFDERSEDTKIIIAREGKINKEKDNISLSLIDGKAFFSRGATLNEVNFKEYIFRLSPNIEPIAKKNSELSLSELISKISKEGKIDYKLELYKRFSLPFLCLISVYLAPALCMLIGRSGRLGGITAGLIVFAVYYVLMIYGVNLAKSGRISAEMGSFAPVIIVGILTFALYKRIRH
ncbi:LptF/LptG family permease [Thermodesulfovibrio sp.]|uniref:LptF/LptG family permease n=1 Tax=Thermodesulfovibrio sp. TaxID=2067987 RepID=UPI0030A7E848